MARRILLVGLGVFLASPSVGIAGMGAGAEEPGWELGLSVAGFLLPDEADYLQPTITAGLGALHLESRYAYEDRGTFSAFAGWTFTLGGAPRIELTPMAGIAVGRTDGVAPALELAVTWGPIELYSENEWVLVLPDQERSFFYGWSELTARAAGWLRFGAVAQRTRAHRAPRDVSLGPMVSFTAGRLAASLYLFEPWGPGRFAAASVELDL